MEALRVENPQSFFSYRHCIIRQTQTQKERDDTKKTPTHIPLHTKDVNDAREE